MQTELLQTKARIRELTARIPLLFSCFGRDLCAADKTMIVMIFFRNEVDFDRRRAEYIKEFIERDMRIFDQLIVVTNFGSYNNELFTKLFLPELWKTQIHLRVYQDNSWENAGVMRYRCFHTANQIPSSGCDQIVFIRDDRRSIYALASPSKTVGIQEEGPGACDLYKERLENIRTGSPMPSFSEKQKFEKLNYFEVMTVPSQMAKGRAIPEERGKKSKPRNNSGDYSSLNQCLIFTRSTVSYLWDNDMCYPPGPILEDYVFANMCYLAGLKARKTAAFIKRTGDFESYARPNDTQQQGDSVVETAKCWGNSTNANLAATMAECLRFEYHKGKITFHVGTTCKTFGLNAASGGGSYHCIAAYLSMQRLKDIIKSKKSFNQISLPIIAETSSETSTISSQPSTPRIFDKVGLPPSDWRIMDDSVSVVRASSATEYHSYNRDISGKCPLSCIFSKLDESSFGNKCEEGEFVSLQRSRSISDEIENVKKRARYT